ncbi:uncharacterized protein LOC117899453 [Drosophila subobscura]|uniref:uncharacterized protein LOC117899453 n=1 Tax=Drosophila subobscura TaxID=7241 RepID=UPI00155A29BD|nr:uncharacterized protein LOC117899453 [Drosophila subobscura]
MDKQTFEDLKAFERRLGEIVSSRRQTAQYWRPIVLGEIVCSVICALFLLDNPHNISYLSMMLLLALLVPIFYGIKLLEKKIILGRYRMVLNEYALDVSEDGKLIIQNNRI